MAEGDNGSSKPFEKMFRRYGTGSQDVVWEPGSPLPAFMELDGHKVVLVDLNDYRELVGARTQLLKLSLAGPKPKGARLGLSTIERDADVADFLRARFQGGITLAQLHQACNERFGADRTPSVSRIANFRQRARRAR